MFIVLISVLATCKWLLALCCLLNLIYYNIKLTHAKTKARFGRLLQPPARKGNGSILEGVDTSGIK